MEQQRDYLLSTILSLDALARAGKLTNENVVEITKHTLKRLSAPGDQEFEEELAAATAGTASYRRA
jgi:hypothetical protein